MEILLAKDFQKDCREEMSQIFVDGFYQWLHFFSKDKSKLTRAFAHMFSLDVFYVAVVDGKIAGITACSNNNASCVHLNAKELRKHLGLLMGTITYRILKHEFEDKKYPFDIASDMGLIEFVATSPDFRGCGVATKMITHIIDTTPYKQYCLEVADTNTNAVKLYEKLGFNEFQCIPQKHSKKSGVDNLVYMKYEKA